MIKAPLNRLRRKRGMTRRSLITGALGLAMSGGLSASPQAAPASYPPARDTAAAAPSVSGSPASGATETRSIGVRNLNTGERADVTYCREGFYDRAALSLLDFLMRDWRTEAVTAMDPALYDMVWSLGTLIGQDPEFTVICGYRSPTTNQSLAASGSNGVARNSLHVQGKAADIAVSGCPVGDLRDAAITLQAGGVGYYPGSGFVHIDTGAVRSWRG